MIKMIKIKKIKKIKNVMHVLIQKKNLVCVFVHIHVYVLMHTLM